MPMHTPDGRKTYKFDQTVPDDVKEAMEAAQKECARYEQRLTFSTEVLDRRIDAVDMKHDNAEKVLDDRMGKIYMDLTIHELRVNAFLRSRFVRFLNFFGCWFIYGVDGYVYFNDPKNESFGDAPLLTRIKRWFKNHILE